MTTPTTPSTQMGTGGRWLPRGSGAVGLAAVLITGVALALAAAAPAPQRQSGVPSGHTTAIGRTLVCAGGLSHGVARLGVVGGSGRALTVRGAHVRKSQASLGKTPVVVTSGAATAAHTYAVRSARGRGWFAAGACPGPRSDWWFVGAGASQAHHSSILITNPLAGGAVVNVRVLGPKGLVRAPGLRNINVASGATVKLDLAHVAPAVGDLAVEVRTTRGLVTASAPESWSPDFVARPTGDWVADQPGAGRRVTLAGLPARGGATALVANPGTSEAVVAVTLVGTQGIYAPTTGATVRVPPETVVAVNLGAALRTHPDAVRLTSNVPISATVRSTTGTDSAYAPTLTSLGADAVAGIPAHPGNAELILVAGSARERVVVVGYDLDGTQVGTRTLTIPARASLRTPVWGKAASLRITGATAVGGVVRLGAQRKVGLAVLGLVPSASESRVPPVAPTGIGP